MYIEYKQDFSIGDKVKLLRDVTSMLGYFEKGSIVTIVRCDEIRGWTIEDEEENSISEVESSAFGYID